MKQRRAGVGFWGTMVLTSGLMVLAGCAMDLATLQKRLEPHYRIQRPEGTGPFPAVLMVSGCGGFASSIAPTHYVQMAERFKKQGHVVVFVDYLAAHGVGNACRGEMSQQEVGQYVLAAASYVRTLPFVKASEIRVIGWSLGGGGVLASVTAVQEGQSPPFRAVAAYYPHCSGLQPWKIKIPTIILLGALDDVTPPDICQGLLRNVPQGSHLEVHLYPNARHGFDAAELPPVMAWRGTDRTVGYNPRAAAAAWEEIRRLLTR